MKVTNLTPHNPAKARQQNGSVDSLVVDDFGSGFRVERYSLFEGGIGISGKFWYEGATGLKNLSVISFGLIPIKGSQIHTIQYVRDQKAISQLPKITQPPMKAEDLESWEINDSSTMMKSGGVIYFGGLGVGAINFNRTKIAKGTWSVFVQKKSETSVYVKLTNGKLSSVSDATNVGPVSVGLSTFNNADDSFSYLVDIESEYGKRAYEDLVRGNVAAIQKFVAQDKVVRQVDSRKALQSGNLRHSFLGIPILMNITNSAGQITSVEETDIKIENSKANVNYGVYTEDHRARFFGEHTEKTLVFYGASYRITDAKGVNNGFFGTLSLDLRDDSASRRNLQNFIDEVVRTTGFKNVASVQIPKVGALDYAGVHFEMTVPQDQTERLMNLATGTRTEDFVAMGMRPFSHYTIVHDPFKLCSPQATSDGEDCLAPARANAEEGLKKMWQALRTMNANRNNPAAFTAAYAQFGEGMLASPINVQTALRGAGAGVEITYRIEGARTSYFEKFMLSREGGDLQPVPKLGEPLPVQLDNEGANHQRGILVSPGGPIYPPVNP